MTVTGTFDVITDWGADAVPSPSVGLALALQWGPLAHAVSPRVHTWGAWTHTYGARPPVAMGRGGCGTLWGPHLGVLDAWTHTYGAEAPWSVCGGVVGGPGVRTWGSRMPGPTLMWPKCLCPPLISLSFSPQIHAPVTESEDEAEP